MFEGLLCDKEDILVILEGLIKLDAGGMVQSLQYLNFVEKNFRLLDVLFVDLLDSSPLRSSLLLRLVDHTISALTQFLCE